MKTVQKAATLLFSSLLLMCCLSPVANGFAPNPIPTQRIQIGGKTTSTMIQSQLQAATLPASVSFSSSTQPSSSSAYEESTLFSNNNNNNNNSLQKMGKVQTAFTKAGMMAFILSMCLTLPIVLTPQYVLYKLRLVNRVQKEQMALKAGQFCARWMLRLIPFCSVKTIPYHDPNPEPSIWVCNHVSALDIFMLLATDKQLRGTTKRPIKIVYVSAVADAGGSDHALKIV